MTQLEKFHTINAISHKKFLKGYIKLFSGYVYMLHMKYIWSLCLDLILIPKMYHYLNANIWK